MTKYKRKNGVIIQELTYYFKKDIIDNLPHFNFFFQRPHFMCIFNWYLCKPRFGISLGFSLGYVTIDINIWFTLTLSLFFRSVTLVE